MTQKTQKTVFSRLRIPLLLLAALALLLATAFWAIPRFLPLQAAELETRWQFWREGVAEVEAAGLKGYVRDACHGVPTDAPDSAPRRCSCVAMVHGLADSSMTWKKVLLWPDNGWLQPVKLFAFDLPGSGRSAGPADPSGYRVREQARALREALSAQKCSRWVVVGNSLGGWIGAWLALDWSEGVRRLILLDSAGLTPSSGADESIRLLTEATPQSMKEFQARAYYRGRPLPDQVWSAVAERMRASNARAVIEAQRPEDYLEGRLPSLRVPTLLMWGAADRVTPPAEGQRFKSLIRGGIWRELPECGHLPQKECPLEVIRAIANMIDYGAA